MAELLEQHGDVDFGVVEIDGRWHSFSIFPDVDGTRRSRYAGDAGHATRDEAIADMRSVADEFDRLGHRSIWRRLESLHESVTRGASWAVVVVDEPDPDALDAMRDELRALESWKSGALLVLREWESVWETAGQPGQLGAMKARSTADEIRRLRAENERLRAIAGVQPA